MWLLAKLPLGDTDRVGWDVCLLVKRCERGLARAIDFLFWVCRLNCKTAGLLENLGEAHVASVASGVSSVDEAATSYCSANDNWTLACRSNR